MLMTKERRPAIPTLRGWAVSVLQEAGAIRECEEHGWMQDRADPHARELAFDIARLDPPLGISAEAAAVAIAEVVGRYRRHVPGVRGRGPVAVRCFGLLFPPKEGRGRGLGFLPDACFRPNFRRTDHERAAEA